MPVKDSDTPAIAKKRNREIQTVSQMISLYCAKNHRRSDRTEISECGEKVCAECRELDAYAALRTERCRRMADKVSCDLCQNHCYAPAMQERIRVVMRYSGPRMLFVHPIAAIRHLAGKLKRPPSKQD